jgi:hypothetical protein
MLFSHRYGLLNLSVIFFSSAFDTVESSISLMLIAACSVTTMR